MREIKFRGIHIASGSFVYGDLINKIDGGKSYTEIERSVSDDYHNWTINPESVGQYTGLKDKNGVDIYEFDICKILYSDWPSKSHDDPRTLHQYLEDIAKVGVIEYCQDGFYFVTKDRHGEKNYSHINPGTYGFIKVIGNIYSNPELLKP